MGLFDNLPGAGEGTKVENALIGAPLALGPLAFLAGINPAMAGVLSLAGLAGSGVLRGQREAGNETERFADDLESQYPAITGEEISRRNREAEQRAGQVRGAAQGNYTEQQRNLTRAQDRTDTPVVTQNEIDALVNQVRGQNARAVQNIAAEQRATAGARGASQGALAASEAALAGNQAFANTDTGLDATLRAADINRAARQVYAGQEIAAGANLTGALGPYLAADSQLNQLASPERLIEQTAASRLLAEDLFGLRQSGDAAFRNSLLDMIITPVTQFGIQQVLGNGGGYPQPSPWNAAIGPAASAASAGGLAAILSGLGGGSAAAAAAGPATAGVLSASQAGLLAALPFVSDVNAKENISAKSDADSLRAARKLPVYDWEYIGTGRKHTGPMAQDFSAAVGGDGKTIDPIDYMGTLLGAIRELDRKVGRMEAA